MALHADMFMTILCRLDICKRFISFFSIHVRLQMANEITCVDIGLIFLNSYVSVIYLRNILLSSNLSSKYFRRK